MPVTAVKLSDSRVDPFLNDAFPRIAISMVCDGLRDASLVVTNRISGSAHLEPYPELTPEPQRGL